jgi:hypothetical protein
MLGLAVCLYTFGLCDASVVAADFVPKFPDGNSEFSVGDAQEAGIPVLESDDGVFRFIVDETGQCAKILLCLLNQPRVVIPAEVASDGKPYNVYECAYDAFGYDSSCGVESRDAIKELKIENGVVVPPCFGGLPETLEKLTIPKSVTLGGGFFDFLLGAPELILERDDVCVVDGIIYNREKTVLIAAIPWQMLPVFVAPPTLEEISVNAFRTRQQLTGVDLSRASRLKKIDVCAFSNQEGIKGVVIPPLVVFIGERAFGGCRGITELTFLGKSDQLVIEEEAFRAKGATKWKIHVPKGEKDGFLKKFHASGYPVLSDNVVEFAEQRSLGIMTCVVLGGSMVVFIGIVYMWRKKKSNIK